MQTESNSSLSTFRDCPRLYRYKYIDMLVPDKTSESLSLGLLGHNAMEIYYKDGLPAALEMLTNFDADDQDKVLRIGKVKALLNGYVANYGLQDFDKVLEVETEFKIPMVNPETGHKSNKVELVGKIDLIAEKNGENWLIDHKFKGTVGERDFWSINSQMDLYLNAFKEKYNCKGIIWNIIRTPSIRQTQKETLEQYLERLGEDVKIRPEFYYTRFVMPRWDEDIKESMQDIWDVHDHLLRVARTGKFYRNTSCCHKFGTCQFLPLCANGLDKDSFVKKEKKHSELQEVVF